MKLFNRGIAYTRQPVVAQETETQAQLKFRGCSYTLNPPVVNVNRDQSDFVYRGVSVEYGKPMMSPNAVKASPISFQAYAEAFE